MHYFAKAQYDEGAGYHFVRLYRREGPSDGGEFVGLCEANGPHEASLIADCINSAINYDAEDSMILIRRMFDGLAVESLNTHAAKQAREAAE